VVKKGVTVWILGSLTFLAGLHSLDSFLWLTSNEVKPILLSYYPVQGILDTINPIIYLICSVAATFLFWGGTTIVALRNPIETFLGKALEDGKSENQAEVEFLEAKTSILEMMSETLTNNSRSLAGLRDVIFGVRSEVLKLGSMNSRVEDLSSEIVEVRKTIKRMEREIKKHKLCPVCGRDILPEFRLCPFCGENLLKPVTGSHDTMLASLPALSSSNRPKS
jgi:predicted nucleic acid-binding Zn ribbon protein